jgi:hypothetical protein
MNEVSSIATLVTGPALEDFEVLLFTLSLWNKVKPRLYIFTDSATKAGIDAAVSKYYGSDTLVNIKVSLNKYSGLKRAEMEARRGEIYTTLFGDFTAEKTTLMEWALETEKGGVLFCDADICHLAGLPQIPDNCMLALSPHMIREGDAAKYGYYNAGYLWIKDTDLVKSWRSLCTTSHFFEQACLEDLAIVCAKKHGEGSFYEFPIQINYGWWRLWQGTKLPSELQKAWSFFRNADATSGLLVEDKPVQSIHTHWHEKNDHATREFNQWILGKLRKLSSVRKTKQLTSFLEHRGSQN